MISTDILKSCVLDLHNVGRTEFHRITYDHGRLKIKLLKWVDRILNRYGFAICRMRTTTFLQRLKGQDWPTHALTMIGTKRLNNFERCIRRVIQADIPGDIIECGVWRGGACLVAQSVLIESGEWKRRKLFVADSFEGLPKPDGRYKQDEGDKHYAYDELKSSLYDLTYAFHLFGLERHNVCYLKGWFKDTLPGVKSNLFAVIRLDGDMYGSTMDSLTHLYPKLSIGGYCIIDDYNLPGARQAVHDYRESHGIKDEIIAIDECGVYWEKTK